jgi:hypothetical protein
MVKEKLLSLKIPCDDFTLVFSGKASARVNGLYKPGIMTIIIHNRNFQNDDALMYTALHEFTHHIAHTRNLIPGRNKHPTLFWALFHSIIDVAIKEGVYHDPYLTNETLKTKQDEILDLLKQQDELNKKLGVSLAEMLKLSSEKGAQFGDFLDRHARIPKKQAENLIKAQLEFDLEDVSATGSPALVDAVIGQGEDMAKAADMAVEGCSIQQIRAFCGKKKAPVDLFTLPEEEEIETKEERLERMKDDLKKEIRKKERCEMRISQLMTGIDELEGQLTFGFETEGQGKEASCA